MRSKLTSLKFQILVAFGLMAVPLYIFAYLMFTAHSTFTATLNATFIQEEVRSLTASLQRDVMDLQRNVLRYKSVASDNSINNIEQLNEHLQDIIGQLKSSHTNLPLQAVNSIEHHLNEYKNSFDTVVSYRDLRAKLVNEHKHFSPEVFVQSVTGLSEFSVLKIKENLYEAQNYSLGYLINSDSDQIDDFKKTVRYVLNDLSEKAEENTSAIQKLKAYEKNFLKIVNLTRNYVYLINVVMAGSAQEILFYSEFLAQNSRELAGKEQDLAHQQLQQFRSILVLISIAALLVAFLVPTYFFRLITRPIESITKVFQNLIKGQSVTNIPGQGRDDEIGHLAKAASVFMAKNEQTQHLLDQAEKNIHIQSQLNKELEVAKRKSEKALSVKSEFLANMSHELRTPLNSVIGYTVRLLKNPKGFNERQLAALNTVERNGRHLLAMINDILDLSKIDADKMDVNFQYIELVDLCTDVMDQLAEAAEEKGLDLQLDVDQKTSITVETDQVRLTQILINLLSNGIKYTESGWVKLSIRPALNPTQIVISIADSGVGIRDEDKDKLFKRFEQFDEHSRYKIGHGTGLGLAIVAKLSRLLGVKISVQSEFGCGSVFSVTIPRKRSRSLSQNSSAA